MSVRVRVMQREPRVIDQYGVKCTRRRYLPARATRPPIALELIAVIVAVPGPVRIGLEWENS